MNNLTSIQNFKNKHIHFVGIKGTGMVALVELLLKRGAIISGSDVSERFYTDEILEKYGIKALPFSKDNISDDVNLVIYSSAYNFSSNPDLISAKEKNIPSLLYSQMLGEYSKTAFSAGICGVHGKTTTTGLSGTIFRELPLKGQSLAGSIISSFGNSCTFTSENLDSTEKPFFIAETCEYQRHFMAFEPKIIVLTSVESDHQDYYPTFNDIQNAFVDYICKLPQNGKLIYCFDDEGAQQTAKIAFDKRNDLILIPYGKKCDSSYKITVKELKNGEQNFNISSLGDFAIKVPGIHNVLNATAAVALNIEFLKEANIGVKENLDKIRKGLLNFKGGKRRSEVLGIRKNASGKEIIFIDDYGHHPTAINSTLEGFKNFYSNHKLIVDFMSHTYSRTESLFEEFASCFSSADKVIINKIYASARENAANSKVTGELLAKEAQKFHKDVTYCQEFADAARVAQKLLNEDCGNCDGYVFVTMGAGDNWKVSKILMEEYFNKE